MSSHTHTGQPVAYTGRVPSARSHLRLALLSTHVAVAVSVLGVDTALLVLAVGGVSGSAPATVYPAMHRIAADLLVPLAVAALVTGLAQVVVGRWNPLREWWIAVKLVVTVAGTALAVLVLAPGLAHAASSAAGHGDPQFLTSGRQHGYAVILAAQCALLVSLAGLGVFKPGARRRRVRPVATASST